VPRFTLSGLWLLVPACLADLAEEALRVVSTWSFHPAMCEYQPANQEMDFEVTFKGW